jgi:hypothetical protein
MQSAQDFYEEYIAAWIWPLKKGWGFVRFHEKLVKGKTYIFPDNEVFRQKNILKTKILFLLLKLNLLRFLVNF